MKTKKKVFIWIISFVLIAAIICSIWLFVFYLRDRREKGEWQQFVEIYRANKIQTYEEENLVYEDYEVDVAFLGDSLTDGYDVKNYYPNYKVVNRGIGGDTTFWLEKRLDVSLYNVKTKVAIMLIGANNMDTMFENYQRILQSFRENVPKTKIILLSLTSMGGEWGKKNHL